MNITERLQYIMKLNNLSASAFADKIEVQRSSISHILSGRNKPSLEFIQKVLAAFPKVSSDWLLTGNTVATEIIPSNQAENKPNPTDHSPPTPTNKHEDDKKIQKIVVFYSDNTFEEFHQG
ncbi:MAG: helix-turn-helix domain-containing protein [Flavobacteriales bacterium]|nr:helix-turn-helix domain-containing protein [Flavobacteriales bacterium]MCW8912121.1 helix-turn-helix domain-containing protein [Flavobacteriales bacterium]MCW8936761.1 helix-turn-helix domain-containing protein [Flavobacteriales bacterium]MCW8939858.1 helix-turn-helix domain-containing protein [Flavobacteriales bacterium]MCW8967082.1 helix-turn-helix domain-containing protein [Flavobacteriales bacterium]